jgi:dimethylargininase
MLAFIKQLCPELDRNTTAGGFSAQVDSGNVQQQLRGYANALRQLGSELIYLPSLPEGGPFIGETALLLPELAVIARIQDKRSECAVPRVLSEHRPIQSIREGKLQGSDVLRVGRKFYVARTVQTDDLGIAGLREIVEAFGYQVCEVELTLPNRLKKTCTFIPPNFVVMNPAWISGSAFGNLTVIELDPAEPQAANTLTIDGKTLVSASFPKTEELLRQAGVSTQAIDISEIEKVNGCLTDLSLILEPRFSRPLAR